MPQLFYTQSAEGDMQLIDHQVYATSSVPQYQQLHRMGEQLLQAYSGVLNYLSTRNKAPNALRLQNAFAAAVFDVEEDDLFRMGEEEKAGLREKACDLFIRGTPPALVVYVGKHRTPRLQSSPSTSASLTFTTASSDKEYEKWFAWDKEWDAAEGPWPCPWGWHTRCWNDKRFCIFLSGAYAIWPQYWDSSAWTQHLLLQTHAQVTMFHELIHAARTVGNGVSSLTPAKIIDHPSKAKRVGPGEAVVGEAGRYGEKVAFGAVVDICFESDRTVTLFASDPSKPPGTADFRLSGATDITLLFHQSTPPINFVQLAEENQYISVPEYTRTKAGGCGEGTVNVVIGDIPPIPPAAAEPSGFIIPATGPLQDHINKHRDDLKPRCVESDS